ncbi:MAG: nicotinate-nucleotide adenylyltransferase [Bacteroidaceae bacterium]|nr:nicotinate-nucleotide adenylyltransferase [Bacteroidaceae bacterium]MBR1789387.1 nicotinate-nucleotide adenylyltransferase [Bacteroidaceae bacterium]
MTTGIFGGSFNPIHTGHTRLGEWLVRKGFVDELWFLVSPLNPFKQTRTDLLDDAARVRLARLAVEGKPGLCVSDFEMHLPRPSYMVRTLEELRKAYPERDFCLIIGADNWVRFPQWKDSEEILRRHRVLVYPRPGCPLSPTAERGVHFVPSPLFDISSTQIRQAIATGRYHGRGLAPAVWREIKKKGYYL